MKINNIITIVLVMLAGIFCLYFQRWFYETALVVLVGLSVNDVINYKRKKRAFSALTGDLLKIKTRNNSLVYMTLLNMITVILFMWFNPQINTFFAVVFFNMIALRHILTSINEFHYADRKGIHELNGNLVIDKAHIKEIVFENNKIRFHTTKAFNDLIIRKNRVRQPAWDVLTTQIDRLLNENPVESDFRETPG